MEIYQHGVVDAYFEEKAAPNVRWIELRLEDKEGNIYELNIFPAEGSELVLREIKHD